MKLSKEGDILRCFMLISKVRCATRRACGRIQGFKPVVSIASKRVYWLLDVFADEYFVPGVIVQGLPTFRSGESAGFEAKSTFLPLISSILKNNFGIPFSRFCPDGSRKISSLTDHLTSIFPFQIRRHSNITQTQDCCNERRCFVTMNNLVWMSCNSTFEMLQSRSWNQPKKEFDILSDTR